MQKWYAVHTKPHKEFVVDSFLSSQTGTETYLPTLEVTPVNPRSRTQRPFFPGYLFVQADLQEVGLSTLRWAPGVARVLSYGRRPVPIPDRVIEGIRRRVSQYDDRATSHFRHGEHVRISAGPFEGFEGMFDREASGAARARVLVAFVDRLTAVELDMSQLEKMESSSRFYG